VAIAVASLLAVNAAGLPLLAAPEPASCCCHHHEGDAKCACPICAHARELASNDRTISTCTLMPESAVVVAIGPWLPPSMALVARASPSRQDVHARLLRAPPDPICEVPTPPPLAAS
jgi:hypothetical protein